MVVYLFYAPGPVKNIKSRKKQGRMDMSLARAALSTGVVFEEGFMVGCETLPLCSDAVFDEGFVVGREACGGSDFFSNRFFALVLRFCCSMAEGFHSGMRGI